MSEKVTRRVVLAGIASAPIAVLAGQDPPKTTPLPVELVRDFVGAGHGDLDKVKKMLAETPTLLNATYDWRNGDFEAAIGGAGHVGRADIANYLIEQGARYDIFVAAMLGELDVVKAMIKLHPAAANAKGPHGITLKRHAEKGGENAKAVLDYLNSLS